MRQGGDREVKERHVILILSLCQQSKAIFTSDFLPIDRRVLSDPTDSYDFYSEL